MIGIEYIAAPILGGVIGYITNDIAIRMLFRPHTAKYICGIHIPFTPGIIPKEKGRIADSIGKAISENLMNKEILERYLLSAEMIAKLRVSIENFINVQKENEDTVNEFLAHYLSKEEIDSISSSVNSGLTNQISIKLTSPEVGNKVAHLAMHHIITKLNGEESKNLLDSLIKLTGLSGGIIGGPLIAKLLDLLYDPLERFLARHINDILQHNGQQIVSNMIGDEVSSFLDKKVCELLSGHEEQLDKLVNTIESVYRIVIKEHLPQILASIDIAKIVRERINEMDVNETEKLILQVMNKELRAIVWLGAGLGLLMGSVNCLML